MAQFSAHRRRRFWRSLRGGRQVVGRRRSAICRTSFDLDGAVAAGGSDEFLDAPTGLVLDVVADCHRGDHDAQVRFDRFAQVVVDRSGLQVVFGHPEALLDAPQLVVGVDDELRGLAGQVGGVALPSGQGTVLGLQLAVDGLGRAGQLDEPVAFDRGVTVDGPFGLGDLLVDAAQRAPRPVMAELVVDDPVGDPAGLLRCWWPATAGSAPARRESARRGVCRAIRAPRRAETGSGCPG